MHSELPVYLLVLGQRWTSVKFEKYNKKKNQSVVSFQTGLRETLLSAAWAEGRGVEQIPKPPRKVFYLCSSMNKDQVQSLTLEDLENWAKGNEFDLLQLKG